ncbi:MAG: cell division protein FtsQ/DivIB [Zoogloeaceae bacterium]|jgi:cell division protein FtsQ|nr:cell division protein FtsQ/DivIB [Zoogloeaceae bacterium]
MWHRPQLLNALADLLFLAGAAMLLAAAVVWLLRQPVAPIREVTLQAPPRYVSAPELADLLQDKARGNFLGLSLNRLRESLEALPWVRKAMVRRVWPNRLEITLEEHQPLARWGVVDSPAGHEWVNSHGEVFAAALPQAPAPELLALPQFRGPLETAPLLLQRYGEFAAQLQPLGFKPARMSLSSRLALEMKFDNGLTLKLGREQKLSPIRMRLQRFIDIYPAAVAGREPRPAIVDLRYPNGFTLYPAGTLPGEN